MLKIGLVLPLVAARDSSDILSRMGKALVSLLKLNEKDQERKYGRKTKEARRKKTTAPRIPAWSPTVVLTGRHPG